MTEFDIPEDQLVAKVYSARIVSPADREVDMPIDPGGYVGMVDREHFDKWLRVRAAEAGAVRRAGLFERLTRDEDGISIVEYRRRTDGAEPAPLVRIRARSVIGADGAVSAVAKQAIRGGGRTPYVFAYHEIVRSPVKPEARFDGKRCDVYYQGELSPDFYAWVFPHGDTTSVGAGSAHKGFSLKGAVGVLRKSAGLDGETIRREGAPIPLKPLKRWDNGRDVVLAGDAAGIVAPASGEGIYYAMLGGRLAGDAVDAFLETGDARQLSLPRKRFMKAHGTVFWVLGIMQKFWYSSDKAASDSLRCAPTRTCSTSLGRPTCTRGRSRRSRWHMSASSSRTWPIFWGSRGRECCKNRPLETHPVRSHRRLRFRHSGRNAHRARPWYRGLAKPDWQPPDWAFGPAWTIIFALAAISAALAWRYAPTKELREWVIGLFALNGFLNVLWSLLFFRLQRPDWTLVEVVFLTASIAVLMVFIWRWSRLAAALLVVYLAWVIFASVLNWEIVRLNGSFG